MKFTPRILKENVNISKSSPLRELFVLLTGIFAVVLLIYIILGLTLDILVTRMPVKFEQTVGSFFAKMYDREATVPASQIRIQGLLDDLVKYIPDRKMHFTVHIQKSPDANAVTLPGGHIVLFSGLLEAIESENELAMILAHELGHFVYQDHLRGLGRGIVLVFMTSIIFGADSTIAELSQRMLVTAELKFSRQQEQRADMFALEVLNKKYGHVGGAFDFFERIKGREDEPRFCAFFSTHPYPVGRITLLKEQTRQKGYLIKEKIPYF